VARALENLPLLSEAMSKGQLSYSKVRALTRVATRATESVLLNIGLHGTAHHVERLVQQFRRVQEAEALSREKLQYEKRGLTYFHDEDGAMVVKLRLTAESGALLLRAIERALPEIPIPGDRDPTRCSPGPRTAASSDRKELLHIPAGTSEASETVEHPISSEHREGSEHTAPVFREAPVSFSARRADALIVLCESFLAHGADELKGGDRHQIVVHVDEATLKARESGTCALEEGPAIAVETARRLSCDASKVEIVEDEDGEPLNVGRKTRTIPPSLRRALKSRDQGCVYPGCNHKRYVDGHHIQHWAEGGETKLSNLVSLCRFHHRAVHEGGIRIERCDDGAWRFIRKSGESVYACAPNHTQPFKDWTELAAKNAERGIHIDANTAATRWRGESMDYGIAVESLLYRSRPENAGRGAKVPCPPWNGA
jgi:hypothetical protein